MPLQADNDAQVHEKSDFDSTFQFIDEVIQSFPNMPPSTLWAIKYCRMDHGCNDYNDYSSLIEAKVRQLRFSK